MVLQISENTPLIANSRPPRSRVSLVQIIIGALGVFSIITCFYKFYIDSRRHVAPRLTTLRHLDFEPEQDRRLIIVGDVHATLGAIKNLLEDKLQYDQSKDHIVFLGDLMSKGPQPLEVLEYVETLGASCVIGNHEHIALREYSRIHHLKSGYNPKFDIQKKKFKKVSDQEVAKMLTPRHINFLQSCPAILELPKLGYGNTKAVAVHAGLQWDIPELKDQDPEVVITIRSFQPPENRIPLEPATGTPWYKVWNEKQEERDPEDRVTVFYGHHSSNGLTFGNYSTGIDTGCYGGGNLTSIVISKDTAGEYSYKLESVSCAQYY